jgi:hypothetical protein
MLTDLVPQMERKKQSTTKRKRQEKERLTLDAKKGKKMTSPGCLSRVSSNKREREAKKKENTTQQQQRKTAMEFFGRD